MGANGWEGHGCCVFVEKLDIYGCRQHLDSLETKWQSDCLKVCEWNHSLCYNPIVHLLLRMEEWWTKWRMSYAMIAVHSGLEDCYYPYRIGFKGGDHITEKRVVSALQHHQLIGNTLRYCIQIQRVSLKESITESTSLPILEVNTEENKSLKSALEGWLMVLHWKWNSVITLTKIRFHI